MQFGYVAIMWILAGVCLYAGLSHLQIGLRRPLERLHVLFGVVCVLTGVAVIAGNQLITAQTPAEYQIAAWQCSYIIPLLLAVLPWFVREDMRQTARWPATVVSGAYVLVVLVNGLLPHSVMLSAPPVLGELVLPWGEHIVQSVTPPHAWLMLFWTANGLAVIYLLSAVVDAFRTGPAARAWIAAASVAPFAIAVIVQSAMGVGFVGLITYIGFLGLLVFILSMSVLLTDTTRRAGKQMQTVLDNVPVIVYLKGADGRYVFANRRFVEAYRLADKQILGRFDDDLFTDSQVQQRKLADQQVLALGKAVENEETIISGASDDARSYAALRFPLRDRHGTSYAVCGIATDVTDRKAAADVLRDLAATLERRVARRTEELAQLNRELEAFAYSVSHDLRAPLTAVNGFAELLLREQGPRLDQTANRYLGRIRDGSLRMAALIQDLLGLSRVTQQTLVRQRTDLIPLVDASIKAMHEADPARVVTVTLPTTLAANGDPQLLSLAMTNLLSNAWKYTSKTVGPCIEVGSFEQSGQTVYFVKDNGAGFNPAYTDRLFRPFVRLHSDSEFPGTGIGLATVARIVSRHGGKIWAESKPNEGAIFCFTLPLSEDDGASALPVEKAS